MINKFLFFITLAFLINGCAWHIWPAAIHYPVASDQFSKDGFTREQVRREYWDCRNDEFRNKEFKGRECCRAVNNINDCMIAKKFIYMDKGYNRKMKSFCKSQEKENRSKIKVCNK